MWGRQGKELWDRVNLTSYAKNQRSQNMMFSLNARTYLPTYLSLYLSSICHQSIFFAFLCLRKVWTRPWVPRTLTLLSWVFVSAQEMLFAEWRECWTRKQRRHDTYQDLKSHQVTASSHCFHECTSKTMDAGAGMFFLILEEPHITRP